LGIAVFLVPLTTLVVALRKYEQFSARLAAAHWIRVFYDLAWTFALWPLNSELLSEGLTRYAGKYDCGGVGCWQLTSPLATLIQCIAA
jgi:hypothetical protein